MLDFLTLQTATTHPSLVSILYTVLLSFLLSSLIAITYEKTFRGLSYSRNFIQAIILSSIVAGMVMQAIGDNPIRGLGILGALAIIRFRTVFKDPRDIIFMFAAVAAGISCGVFGYGIAVVGTLAFCAAAVALYYSPFGKDRYFDGMLRFNIVSETVTRQALESVMKRYCKNFALITLREMAQGERLDYAYHVKLRKADAKEAFVDSLKTIESIKDVNLMLQETTVEL
ncbi:MAG: DUF4956 domain-containing protein [Chitinispirillaceae bacterium]|nr:DUF4956 domain-containing protein [Chitinispirillaceae bacterium]